MYFQRSASQRTLPVVYLSSYNLPPPLSSFSLLSLRWSHVRVRLRTRSSNAFRGDWLWSLAPSHALPRRLAYRLLCVAVSWDPRRALLWEHHSSPSLWQVTTMVQFGIETASSFIRHIQYRQIPICFLFFPLDKNCNFFRCSTLFVEHLFVQSFFFLVC